ncbi:MAG TPA: BON domain-containing protein [Pyrinomonadaceae bacterium]|nr:BON domain-containing protein [Pyrinomonadaceae bacterium]HMP65318.1 BON domain-containing protein [Pyrinomonadaceae bacterium]
MKVRLLTILCVAGVVFLAACGKNDADLQKAVQEKFAAENISGVSVAVNGGVATLSGEITDITVKTRAEKAAMSVDGIKSVTNNIVVKAPPPAPVADDKMIEGTINEGLKNKNITGVTVTVKDGEVRLSGKVPQDKVAEVMMVANEAKPKRVVNELNK